MAILPYIIGAFYLPHTEYFNPIELNLTEHMNANQTVQQQMSKIMALKETGGNVTITEYVNTQPFESKITQYDSVFPLTKYMGFEPFVTSSIGDMCLNNSGGYILYPDGANITTDIYHKIKTRSEERTLKTDEKICFSTEEVFPFVEPIYVIQASHLKVGENFSREINVVPNLTLEGTPKRDYGMLQGIAWIGIFLLGFVFLSEIKKRVFDGLLT